LCGKGVGPALRERRSTLETDSRPLLHISPSVIKAAMATAGLAYTKGRVVGKGTWGSVCLGTVSKTGRKVAIKEIHRSMERYEVS